MLTKCCNLEILEWVSGLQTDFSFDPAEHKVPQQTKMSVQESNVTSLNIEAMQKVFSQTGVVFQQFVPSKQKKWGQQTSDKSEEFEQVHTLQTFQNGGDSFSHRFVERERLHLQD